MKSIISDLRRDNSQSRYQMIDFFKVIAAILVVIIHACNQQSPEIIKFIRVSISEIAVPFFFMVSGFFFKNGLDTAENPKKYLWNYLKKIGIAFIFWNVVLLPGMIIGYSDFYSGKSFLYIAFVIFRRIFLCGNGFLWYLLVLIESVVVIYFLDKFKSKVPLIILIFIGFSLFIGYDCCFYLLKNTPYGIVNKYFYVVFSWSHNFIMEGIPYMGIGYLYAVFKNRLNSYIYGIAFLVFTAISTLFYFYPFELVNPMGFVHIFYAISFFGLSITTKVRIKKINSVVFREISSVIYFTHWVILYDLIDNIFSNGLNDYLRIILTIVLAVVIYILAKCSNIKFFKTVLNIK